MNYISDNPWPLIVLFTGIAIVAFFVGSSGGRRVAAVCVLLAIGTYFLEQYLVSPQELVESEVETMLEHFKSRDVNAITSQIAKDSQGLATIAEQGLDLVDLYESFHIKSIQVTINNADSATAMVRANGSVTLRKNGGGTHSLPNFWKTIWRLESGQWKLAEATRLNPVNGTEMGYFSAQ